jgi:acetyl esterase/lipase
MTRLRRAAGALAVAISLTACSDSIAPEPEDQPEPETELIDFVDAQYDVVVQQGITYATGEVRQPAPGEKALLLDLYRPSIAGAPALRPGVVIVHGGGFSGGSKTSEPVADLARRLAELGYVAVSIEYRLMGDDPPTEDLATNPDDPQRVAAAAARVDAALAVRWLRDHAADYGVDPDRIGIAGYSAGAVTAIGVAYWEPGVMHADVRAVFALSGGLPGSETRIEAGEPPLLLVHGGDDSARAAQEAVASRAAEVGLVHEMHQLPGIDHQEAKNLDNPLGSGTVWEKVSSFFFEHLDLGSLD